MKQNILGASHEMQSKNKNSFEDDSLDLKELLRILSQVKSGKLTARMPVTQAGINGRICEVLNDIIEINERLVSEISTAEKIIGHKGNLSKRIEIPDARGQWAEGVNSLNNLISDLTLPTLEIAVMINSVARGDLSKQIPLEIQGKPLKGEFLRIAKEANQMISLLRLFTMEVTRVARQVGSEGKLGEQARIKGVAGVWAELTDSVNRMGSNLKTQMRSIAEVTTAVAKGDLSSKITVEAKGEILQLKNTINTMVDQLNSFASEVTRVALEVGTEGILGGQAKVTGVAGTWKNLTDSVNHMAGNLTGQVRNIAEVTNAVAKGNLSRHITVEVKGEMLELKNTVNTMVDQLNGFASEVTRVALEVGTEGRLGGQANVPGVAGTWKDLTDSVNNMASNLTSQVRGIARVVTSVANGNLKQSLSINAQGEVYELTETINGMIDTLAVFAEQVTTVAREVGVEGKLGGQANVPGASGTWLDLTRNVNQLADNLTTQVRAIAEVASAVTKGDLTRMIRVDAKGEVEALKDTINQMIANLKDTTTLNREQDWLKSNLAKFAQMLQGQRDRNAVANKILSELAELVNARYGAFYILQPADENKEPKLKLFAGYARKSKNTIHKEFSLNEGLVGQCARDKERILLTNVPGEYLKINSGIGDATPLDLVILPVLFENNIKAVIELASFEHFSRTHLDFLDQLTESIGIVLNNIETNTLTEELLSQSLSLSGDLKSQQEELTRANDELHEKAELLEKQKEEVEQINKEVEEARSSLEDKAEQLTLTSKYKSEFLANMSHELRTPLNSLLILAQQLFENHDGNLSVKQISYAKTIHSCGNDLIYLINDILDLSKIESGVITADISAVNFGEIVSFVESTFRPVSEAKNLNFKIEIDENLPDTLDTDIQRLVQILKNLLSNAFKFTDKGEVKLSIYRSSAKQDSPLPGDSFIVFSVEDTGIGIPESTQPYIFDAFQQAEGSTSRKYGGTGLGLSICKGFSELLGGAIAVESHPGKGSIFSLYLPVRYSEQKRLAKPALAKQLIKPVKAPAVILKEIDETVVVDDRLMINPTDRVVLIIEDDIPFTRILIEKAHNLGLKVVVAISYLEVFECIQNFKPIAITLDVNMPESNGWNIIKLLKSNIRVRHIPVHVISGADYKNMAKDMGAKSAHIKPISLGALENLFKEMITFNTRKLKKVLLVNSIDNERVTLTELLDNVFINTTYAISVNEALSELKTGDFDCIIVDFSLPDAERLVKYLKTDRSEIPMLVFSPDPNAEADLLLLKAPNVSILQRDGDFYGKLLNEVLTQMHVNTNSIDEDKIQLIETAMGMEDILDGKKVLIVDDDVRNLFALTAAFERSKLEVLTADSGKEALEILENNSQIDIVLMDIMMPDMDGYEAIQRIRKAKENKHLPVIAVTAKAMVGDRKKCIDSGASDYIAKPVKTDQLLSLMRVWLYKQELV